GRLAHGHAPEPIDPVIARAARKAARQKIGDAVEIGYFYLASSDHVPNSVRRSDPAASSAGRPVRARRRLPLRADGLDRPARCDAMYTSQLRYMRLAGGCQAFLRSFAS